MADRITGLGATLKEFRLQSGEVTIADACRRASERLKGAERRRVELGQLKVQDASLVDTSDGDVVCQMDEFSWGLFAKLLNIPLPYLLRLGAKMRALNANYWLGLHHDKEIEIVFRDGELLEVKDGMEVEKGDILDLLNHIVPGGSILRASSGTNSVIWDVIDERRKYSGRDAVWVPGMRVVVRDGLNAPEINPMFVSTSSCGSIECAEYFEKLNIKSLGYNDILHVVGERMSDCVNCADSLFNSYKRIESEEVPNTRRRIALYCRENAVPDRVRKYAVSAYDESGLVRGDFGAIISVFSTLGFSEEVKPASERKLQKLAGHIVTKAHSEERCDKCDALSVEQ